MQEGDFLRPEGFVGGFQDEGDLVQVGVLHYLFEEVKTQEAFSYGVVAVYSGAQFLFAVVQVDGTEVGEADFVVELFPDALVGVFEVIAGGVGVSCVSADSYAGLIGHSVYYASDLPEGESHVGALSGGILDDCGYAAGLFKSQVDALCNAIQALIGCNLLQVAAGVEVEHGQSQLLAALHLIQKRSTRFLQSLRIRAAQIYKVTVMRKYVSGLNSRLQHFGLKLLNFSLLQRCTKPLSLVLGKQSKGRCAYCHCIYRSIENTS